MSEDKTKPASEVLTPEISAADELTSNLKEKGKKSFILYESYYEILKDLSDESRGQLMLAIFVYVIEGKEMELDQISKVVFKFIKQDLDRNDERYKEKVEVNKKYQERVKAEKTKKNEQNKKYYEKKAIKLNKTNQENSDVLKPLKDDSDGFSILKQTEISEEGQNSHHVETRKPLINKENFDSDEKTENPRNLRHLKTPDDVDVNDNVNDNVNDKGGGKEKEKRQTTPPPFSLKILEGFKNLYSDATKQEYRERSDDLDIISSLLEQFPADTVTQKISILFSACYNANLWFTKDGFVSFTIHVLSSHWNEILPPQVLAQSQLEREKSAHLARLQGRAKAERDYANKEIKRNLGIIDDEEKEDGDN